MTLEERRKQNREWMAEYRRKNPEKVRQYDREQYHRFRASHPEIEHEKERRYRDNLRLGHPLHSTLKQMKHRCKYDPRYSGIRVCDRWSSLSAFEQDMGPCPPGHEIHRWDDHGDYEPGNCSWVEKNLHRRITGCLTVFRRIRNDLPW